MNTKLLLTALTAAAVGSSASAALITGQSIGIDFSDGGSTAGSGSEANFVVVNGSVAGVATTDTAGGSTSGVTLTTTGINGEMGENYLGSQWQSSGSASGNTGVYAGNATVFSDLSFNDGVWGIQGTAMTITFSGLDDSLSYTLLALGTGGPNNLVEVGINGAAQSGELDYEAYTNSDGSGTSNVTAYQLTGLSTNGSGDLVITLDGTESGGFGFAALHLTAVPEPGSLALMGMGGMCLLRRRRNK